MSETTKAKASTFIARKRHPEPPGGRFVIATPATHKQLAGGEIRGKIRDGEAVQISPTIELPE